MKIYENTTIRVTLTDEQSEQFKNSRCAILSHAMLVLGNRSEAKLMESEKPTDSEIRAEAIERLTIDYLVENSRYDANAVIGRMMAGRIMPQGMERDVETAREYARHELSDNPNPHLASARESLQRCIDEEKKYRQSRSNSTWQIEIIGVMPTQIGMCRYQEVAA